MDDSISRHAAIDTLADMHCKSDEDGYVWIIRSDAWARIDALPSAQPQRRKGNWVCIDGINYECDQCGCVLEDWIQGAFYNYCPSCGTDMREEQE